MQTCKVKPLSQLTLFVPLDLLCFQLGPAKVDELVDEDGDEDALCHGTREGFVKGALMEM